MLRKVARLQFLLQVAQVVADGGRLHAFTVLQGWLRCPECPVDFLRRHARHWRLLPFWLGGLFRLRRCRGLLRLRACFLLLALARLGADAGQQLVLGEFGLLRSLLRLRLLRGLLGGVVGWVARRCSKPLQLLPVRALAGGVQRRALLVALVHLPRHGSGGFVLARVDVKPGFLAAARHGNVGQFPVVHLAGEDIGTIHGDALRLMHRGCIAVV